MAETATAISSGVVNQLVEKRTAPCSRVPMAS